MPALTAACEAVEQRFAAIDPALPATIHRARKELRRFRYLAEVFEPVVPAITQPYLDHLQSLQGDMGRIQDATVLNATVDRYLRKHGKAAGEAGPTRDILDRRRAGADREVPAPSLGLPERAVDLTRCGRCRGEGRRSPRRCAR